MAFLSSKPRLATTGEKRSLKTTLFFETFSLLAVTVLLMGIATFFFARQELMMRAISGLQSAAYARERSLESVLSKQQSQLSVLAKDPSPAGMSSITELVGFRSLLAIDKSGRIKIIAGVKKGQSLDPAIVREISDLSHTAFRPIFDERGWNSYLLSSPQKNARGNRTGTLIAIFDPADIISRFFDTNSMQPSSEVLLASIQNEQLIILHSDGQNNAVPIETKGDAQTLLVKRALGVEQGIEETVDYAGIPVLSVYRTMPSIGWTVIVQMDRYEILKPILRLAVNVIGIGLMLICLLSLSTFTLAKRIIEPLIDLVRKLNGLETVHWRFQRSIFTGNELESVDRAAQELTGRLRESYDHLENLIHKRTEALRKENAQNAALLGNIEYGLLMTDPLGTIVFTNRAAELLSAAPVGQLLGKKIADALPLIDRRNQPIAPDAHPVSLVLRTKKNFSPMIDPEFSFLRSDGTSTAIHLRATPIVRGQECLGSVIVVRDTTDERHINQVKSEFITLVSHQLRTPLSSMRWYLEMLLETNDTVPFSTQQHECIDEISTSNSRMTHLVNALLNVSRLELETPAAKMEAVGLTSLLAEVTDCFKLEFRRKKMNITIDADTQGLLNPETDRALLQLIVENLISNAIKYGREGTNLSVKLSTDTQATKASIAITDEGIGIPESERNQIFQKMYRCTNAKATDTNGNGLGLYISRIAADTIGATITVESDEGKGSTFTVSVPMKRKKK